MPAGLPRGGGWLRAVFEKPFGVFVHTILERWGAPCSVDSAFSRSSIVAGEIYNKSVSLLGSGRVDDASNVVVGVGEETGEAFHQPGSDRSIAFWVFIPCRDFVRTCCEVRIFWDDAELKLSSEDFLS